jgi:hypothetical protein
LHFASDTLLLNKAVTNAVKLFQERCPYDSLRVICKDADVEQKSNSLFWITQNKIAIHSAIGIYNGKEMVDSIPVKFVDLDKYFFRPSIIFRSGKISDSLLLYWDNWGKADINLFSVTQFEFEITRNDTIRYSAQNAGRVLSKENRDAIRRAILRLGDIIIIKNVEITDKIGNKYFVERQEEMIIR